jgi:predicted DNA-binding protein (MmcQ/YjbR family)
MITRQDAIDFCLTLMSTYEDYPFDDDNWTVMRHKGNKKVFAWIFEREGHIWINVKGKPEWNDFLRRSFNSVLPAYHLNKTHWNSIILDGSVPDENICDMITESYELTKPKRKRKNI